MKIGGATYIKSYKKLVGVATQLVPLAVSELAEALKTVRVTYSNSLETEGAAAPPAPMVLTALALCSDVPAFFLLYLPSLFYVVRFHPALLFHPACLTLCDKIPSCSLIPSCLAIRYSS